MDIAWARQKTPKYVDVVKIDLHWGFEQARNFDVKSG